MSSHNRVSVLHGVNLDVLGGRDSEIYGDFSLSDLEIRIKRWAKEFDLEPSFFDTNHEGEFVEHFHRLPDRADAAIVNPGAWTHYSWAIRDAVDFARVPFVEVHLSDVSAREEFRRFSVLEGLDARIGQIYGKGPEGYREALELVAERLEG